MRRRSSRSSARRSAPISSSGRPAQEIEEEHRHHAKPLCITPRKAGPELKRIRIDTLVGMAFSTIISLAIVFATAATLQRQRHHRHRDLGAGGRGAAAVRRAVRLRDVRAGDHRHRPARGAGARRLGRLCGDRDGRALRAASTPSRSDARCSTRRSRSTTLAGASLTFGRHRPRQGALLGGGGQRRAGCAADGGDDADRAQPARDGPADAANGNAISAGQQPWSWLLRRRSSSRRCSRLSWPAPCRWRP